MACGSWLMNMGFAAGEVGTPEVTAKYKGFIGTNIGRIGRIGIIILPTISCSFSSLPGI